MRFRFRRRKPKRGSFWLPPKEWSKAQVIVHLKEHEHQCRCIAAAIHMLKEHP